MKNNKKLSQSKVSAKHFEVKSKPIAKEMEQKLKSANEEANKKIKQNNCIYQQSNSHSSEHVVGGKDYAKNFVENIDKMKSPHKNGITSAEYFGSGEDYLLTQEQRDLKRYRTFINSSAYDEIKEIEDEECEKKLTLDYLRKRGSYHDE